MYNNSYILQVLRYPQENIPRINKYLYLGNKPWQEANCVFSCSLIEDGRILSKVGRDWYSLPIIPHSNWTVCDVLGYLGFYFSITNTRKFIVSLENYLFIYIIRYSV